MTKKTLLSTLLLAAFLGSSTPASAQFFKKLGETVTGAVKGTVKSAAETMVGDEATIKKREQEAKEEAERQAIRRPNGENPSASDDDSGHGPGAGAWGGPPSIKIDFDGFCWECVSHSCDGVFTVQVGDNRRWRFYETKGGKRITDKDWMASEFPLFDKGVCPVKSVETRKWSILKQDGTLLALDPKITAVGNFRDGLAVAEINYRKHFINTKGQVVLPTIELDDLHSYPLTDGTRRLFKAMTGGYGYLDAQNKIVIKAQYNKATNFSSGYAIVYDYTATNNEFWVINTLGKKVAVVPDAYVKSGYLGKDLYVTDFVNGGAVAKNQNTGKYDIVDPQMHVMASFDDASPFCLKRTPSDAGVCVVKNDDWEFPQFCLPNGQLLTNYGDPMVSIGGHTKPYYIRSNDKGEKTIMLPPLLSSYHHRDLTVFHPWKAWKEPWWEYTGYTVLGGSLVTDMGYIMNYTGIVRILNWRYEKYEDFSSDGYAKGVKMSTKGWRKQVSRWIEDLEEHYVFMDEHGSVAVEIIPKP